MVDIQHHFADRGKRFAAYLLDIIPIVIIVFITFYIFFGFDETLDRYFNRGDDIEPRIYFLHQRNLIRDISFLVWMAYCMIMESSARQATFGKSAMGIKVVDASGNRLTFGKSFIRNITKILSIAVLGLGFFWILFDKKKQGWHDKLGKTYVVKNESIPNRGPISQMMPPPLLHP